MYLFVFKWKNLSESLHCTLYHQSQMKSSCLNIVPFGQRKLILWPNGSQLWNACNYENECYLERGILHCSTMGTRGGVLFIEERPCGYCVRSPVERAAVSRMCSDNRSLSASFERTKQLVNQRGWGKTVRAISGAAEIPPRYFR